MGCCQNRPQGQKDQNPDSLPKSVSSYKTESSTSLLNCSSANNLILLLRSHYDSQDWKFLISQVPNPQKINEVPPTPSWAKPAKTIGSLSLVYLTKGCKKFANDLCPIFEDLHFSILQLLKSGSKSQKEQCVLFINYLTVLEKESVKEILIKNNVFTWIIPLFYSEKFELRHICATTCSRIYRMNENAQKMFVEEDGVKALMHIICSGPLRGRFFSRLLQCVIDLVVLPNGASKENKESILKYMDESLVTGVDVSLMNDPVREKFFELISMLHGNSGGV